MTLLTPAAYAKKHGVSARRIQALLAQGRIPGAYQHMGRWAIPEDAPLVTGPSGRPQKTQSPQ